MLNECNLNLILHRIESSFLKYDDAENFAETLFKYMGYEVEKNSPIGNPGVPDLKISKDGEETYIEVKSENDGLKYRQLEWIKNNPDKKVIVMFIIKIPDRKQKISLLEEKRQLVNELIGVI